jgi:hypothetical protein
VATAKTDQDSNKKSFSKVLEGRRSKDKSEREKAKSEEDDLLGLQEKLLDEEVIPKILPLSDNSLPPVLQTSSKVSSAQPVSLKQPLQALVQEISHAVSAQGQETVDIQLNSKVFEGLKIQVVRQPGAFDVRFQSASEGISQLLAQNAGALAQSLAAHGVPVGQIRVNDAEPSRWTSRNPQGRQQGSGGGRGRQRQG